MCAQLGSLKGLDGDGVEGEMGTGAEERSPPASLPQVAHTVHLSALGLPGYHLHAAYAGDWQLSPTEVRTPHRPSVSQSRLACGRRKRVLWGGRSSPLLWFLLNGREEGPCD